MFWDWASTTHEVTVIDNHARTLDRWAAEHTETGLDQTLARLAGHGRPEGCRWPSSVPAAWSWTGCWPPATR
jgi:hypothetical protein